MLTDIFARRYEKRPLFASVASREHAFFVQAYRIINEQLIPYHGADKKVDEKAKTAWTSIHDRLTMELGVKELSARYYSYQGEWLGKPHQYSGYYDMNLVCDAWLTKQFTEDLDEDVFAKRRLSFVELAFRERGAQIAQINANLPFTLQMAAYGDNRRSSIPGIKQLTGPERAQAENDRVNREFTSHVYELNERFKQAGMPLNYHNGFIQITADEQIQVEIEEPFWSLVSDAKYKNVSTDVAEAIDRRDTGGRDPSFYAAKSLESAIKIICEDKGWVTGTEKGVADFLNYMEAKANGPFIEPWERQSMQRFYSDVRNDLGHGPGSKEMPNFTPTQIDQTIEFCMSWVKSLIRRL